MKNRPIFRLGQRFAWDGDPRWRHPGLGGGERPNGDERGERDQTGDNFDIHSYLLLNPFVPAEFLLPDAPRPLRKHGPGEADSTEGDQRE